MTTNSASVMRQLHRAVRRHAVGGAHHAVDDPRLAADLGGEPAGEDRDDARRTHREHGAQQRPRTYSVPRQRAQRAPEPEQDHQHAEPDHDAERPEDDRRVRPVLLRIGLEPRELAVPRCVRIRLPRCGMSTAYSVFSCSMSGQPNERQRYRLARRVLPVALDRRDLGGLVLQRVEPVLVADERLQWRDQQQHPHRHRRHHADCGIVAAPQQVPGAGRADHQRRREVGSHDHVRQPVRERRIEDDGKPVGGDDAPVDDRVAGGRVHPAVGGEDPCRRDQRADGDHHRREEMQPGPDALPAEQHDAQEPGFEEERRQDFVCEQRSRHAAGEIGEVAPVGAELVGHHEARHHAHAEVDGEDLRPEQVEVAKDHALRPQPARLEHREVAREADRDRRENDVERDREPELDPGQHQCVGGRHRRSRGPVRPTFRRKREGRAMAILERSRPPPAIKE